MTEPQTFPSLTRQTIDEHQQIHFFLDQLARSLEELEPGRATLETLRRIGARTVALRERLLEHFGSEEDQGLFGAVADLLPDSRPEIDRLTHEHQQLLEALEMTRIRAQHGAESEAGQLRADVSALLELLREHERREEAMLARAFVRLERDEV